MGKRRAVNIGEIRWVNLPSEGGREQHGRRPAVLIQDENYAGNLPTILVVPLSSTKKALRFAGTTLIASSSGSGLRNDSVALVFQCRAIDRRRVCERIGTIIEEEQSEIFTEWRKLTGQIV